MDDGSVQPANPDLPSANPIASQSVPTGLENNSPTLPPTKPDKPKNNRRLLMLASAVILLLIAGFITWKLLDKKKVPVVTAPIIRIGLSMDTLEQSRWPQDLKDMQTYAAKDGASLTYYVANSVDATQVSQIENLIAQKVNVLIIIAHDPTAVAPTIALAHAAGIKVIAYDRIIPNSNVDFYDSYNSVTVGMLEAKYVIAAVPKTVSVPNVMVVGGAATDPNALQVQTGVMSVLQPLVSAGKIKIVYDQYTPNWDPDTANADVISFLATGVKVNAIICANDGMADGVAAALQTDGLLGKIPLSGQDAAISAIQRLVAGTQTVSVYKPLNTEAKIAIEAAIAFANGKKPLTNTTFNNGLINVPTYLLTPEAVTSSNIKLTVIKDGFLTTQAVYGTSKS